MITAEDIYQKTKALNPTTLQEIADFVDFLLSKQNPQEQAMRQYFPATEFEPADAAPVHPGRTLTLEEMDAAVAEEAGRHR